MGYGRDAESWGKLREDKDESSGMKGTKERLETWEDMLMALRFLGELSIVRVLSLLEKLEETPGLFPAHVHSMVTLYSVSI